VYDPPLISPMPPLKQAGLPLPSWNKLHPLRSLHGRAFSSVYLASEPTTHVFLQVRTSNKSVTPPHLSASRANVNVFLQVRDPTPPPSALYKQVSLRLPPVLVLDMSSCYTDVSVLESLCLFISKRHCLYLYP
jgi:hypothetical protein